MIAGSLPECSAQRKEVFGAAQGRVRPSSGSVIWLPPGNPISHGSIISTLLEAWIALIVGGAGILLHEPWVRWTLRPGIALAAWFRMLRANPERAPAPAIHRFTSLISPIKFPSESRKKTIHKSWSGILASRCGSSSKRTPFPFIFWCAAWMSATAK